VGIFAIAEGLTRDGIPSPSAHDPVRNTHRSGVAWSKGAVRAIASAIIIALVILAYITGVAVLGVIVWVVYRTRQDRRGAPIAARTIVHLSLIRSPAWRIPTNMRCQEGRNYTSTFTALTRRK
jgi:hypothetical protein